MNKKARLSFVLLLGLLLSLTACGQKAETKQSTAHVEIAVSFESEPLSVGATTLIVTLTDESGAGIDGASLRVQGDMDHEGMMPINGEANSSQNGAYHVPFEWTMGGGWIVTVTADLPNEGGQVSQKFEYFVEAASSASIINQAHNTSHNAPRQTTAVRYIEHNADWVTIDRDFDAVPMVLVPAGCFMMGSTEEEAQAAYADFVAQFGEDESVRAIIESETPQHEQCFDTSFWLDQYPVTQATFARYNAKRSAADRFIGDNRPVEVINWFEARDFCALRGGRLPTEAEWEYAARGPDGLTYPWGDTWAADRAVLGREETQGTAEVGSLPNGVSWVGAHDLIGNVWEWTSTIYDLERYSYPHVADDGRAIQTDSDDMRVLRGSAWSSITETGFRAAYRVGSRPQSRYYSLGFRCLIPSS